MRTYFNQLGVLMVACMVPSVSWAVNIFACEPEWAALSKEIAPQAHIYSATTAYQDPHFVQAKPSLIAKMRRADLVICSGAELEIGWLPALLLKANNAKVRHTDGGLLYVAEHVHRLDQREHVDRSMGDVHAMGNPHIHLSPKAISKAATLIANRLAQIDSEQAHHYTQAATAFQTRWAESVNTWEQQAATLQGKQLVAYHTSYRYLFDWLGINQVADLEPKPGLPPTSGHLATLLTQLKGHDVSAVVYTPYQDAKPANWLASKAAIPAAELPYTVEKTESLFSLYQRTIDTLVALVKR